jgi:hypothetical protein
VPAGELGVEQPFRSHQNGDTQDAPGEVTEACRLPVRRRPLWGLESGSRATEPTTELAGGDDLEASEEGARRSVTGGPSPAKRGGNMLSSEGTEGTPGNERTARPLSEGGEAAAPCAARRASPVGMSARTRRDVVQRDKSHPPNELNTERTAQRSALQPRGPHQDIPGQAKQRQAKPGTYRVRGQGEMFTRATSVCKRELGGGVAIARDSQYRIVNADRHSVIGICGQKLTGDVTLQQHSVRGI